MDEQAFRYVGADDGLGLSVRIDKRQFPDRGEQRRFDGIVADVSDPCFDDVKLGEIDTNELARQVADAKNESSPLRIGGGREFIGNIA